MLSKHRLYVACFCAKVNSRKDIFDWKQLHAAVADITGAPHMETILQQATLTEYEGDKDASGLCHGQGRAVFSSGQVYAGQWQHGHMEGQGSISFPDSMAYTGTFAADSISGSGVYTWPSGMYEGEVLNGLRHGCGRLTLADSGVIYEGQWRQGKRHGRGVLSYNSDRTAYYEGEWADDMKHGQGTSVYPSGNTYSGSWVQDQRQGRGSMTWANLAQRYTGHWLQGLPDGFGEHVWEQQRPGAGMQGSGHAMHVMHNRYVGWFKEGQRHGEGTLYYSSGARYEGQWQRGKKHGVGVYVFEDGHVFRGHFIDDKPVMASGAVLGADSTFSTAAAAGSSASRAIGTTAVQLQQQLSLEASPQAAARGEQAETSAAPGALSSSSAAAASSQAGGNSGAGKSVKSTSQETQAPKAAAQGGKAASTSASSATKTAKTDAAGTIKAPTPANKPSADASTAKAPAAAKTPPADAASRPLSSSSQAVGASKRASTAGSTSSAGSAAAAGKGNSANSQSTIGPLLSSSSSFGPSFGPASSVMQLYIADLLQEFEGPPAAVYKAVSNLIVGSNTELLLLYDRYSALPSPLLDSSTRSHSWALQACQVWELLRDARLLCRHVSLQQACVMLTQATLPPPAVQQHRQQMQLAAAADSSEAIATSAAVAASSDNSSCCSPGTPLLFRDFCELLVRLAAARYPLLPSLEMQLQQVISYHLLPLLGGSARQLASGARSSLIAAPAAAALGATSGSCDGSWGCEQQLRQPGVVQYLRDHAVLLQQLHGAFLAAAQTVEAFPGLAFDAIEQLGSQPQPCGQAAPASELTDMTTNITATEGQVVCQGSSREPADGQAGSGRQGEVVTVKQVLACLQERGVLQQMQLSEAATAACLLHNTLAVTDPQGARACIEDAASVTGEAFEDPSAAGTTASAAAAAADQALQRQLQFWLDAPLLLQEVLWGLLRLAVVLPVPQQAAPSSSHSPGAKAAGSSHQQSTDGAASRGRASTADATMATSPKQPALMAATAAAHTAAGGPTSAGAAAADQALQRYRRLFLDDDRGDWDPSMLLSQLQALLEGPGGVFKAVLGWQPVLAGTQSSSMTPEQGPGMSSRGLQQLHEGAEVHDLDESGPDDSEEACEEDEGVGAGEGSMTGDGELLEGDGELAAGADDATFAGEA